MNLTGFGDKANDTTEQKLNNTLMVYLGMALSFGGLIWGSICWYFGLYFQASIPYGYVIVTIVNFSIFGVFKTYHFCKIIQMFISVLLPFLFQWSLGGFIPSGVVMLWSVVALISMLTTHTLKENIIWLIIYLALVILSGYIDDKLISFGINLNLPASLTTVFFVLNVGIITLTVIGINIYFVSQLGDTVSRLKLGQKKIEQSERKLNAIVEYIGQAIINIDSNGKILFANNDICKMFGYKEEELNDKNINDIVKIRVRVKMAKQNNLVLREDRNYIKYLLTVVKHHSGISKVGNEFPIILHISTMQIEKENLYVGTIEV